MKTKKCKFCQTDIPVKAKVCPNCKRTLSKGNGCLITVALFVIGISVFVLIANGGFADLGQEVSTGIDKYNENHITMKEYNEIQTGMTYEQVKKIVGSPGEVSSQVESNGYKVVIVTWYGNDYTGSNANVTFTNDEVTGKAQVGLK